MKRYLGVDLHRTQITVCTRLGNGRTYVRQWFMRDLKLFAAQLRQDDEIAVEATGNTRLFYDAVVKQVGRVVVVNPSQFKVISQSVKKTDRNDAELLALYLSKGLLPEVRMKDREHRNMSHLAQTRDLLLDEFVTIIDRSATTTVYVTHNLPEAVRLGQQIVVLSRRPGHVREIFRIDRPLTGRSSDDPDLRSLEHTLWRIIRDDAAGAERELIDAPR